MGTPTAGAAAKPVHTVSYIRREKLLGWLYMAPLLLLIGVFVLYPLIETFRLSFIKVALSGSEQWVGLDNYVKMIHLASFGQVVWNTFMWVAIGIVAKIAGGLLVALALVQRFRARPLLLGVMLIPWATPLVVSAITWRWIYDGLYGYLNSILLHLGILHQPAAWLSSPRYALLLVLFVHVWSGIPFCALSILSALYAVPETVYRAARMDGAGTWTMFRKITWPQIYPVISILVVLSAIWGFNAFEMIYIMTGGGPGYASETLISNIYRYAFQYHNPGVASALSVVSFLVLLCFLILYAWLNRKLQLEE